MIYTNTHTFTYKNDLLNSFNHMFNHMALKPRCGALRPGALQLGGGGGGGLKPDTFPFCRSLEQYFAPNHHRIILLIVHAEAQL